MSWIIWYWVTHDATAVKPPESLIITIVRPETGNHEIHHVHLAVMIPVVLAEVHLVVYSINRGIDNWSAITKFMGIVLTIIDSYWPHYVELRLELPVGVVSEIVMHTASIDLAIKAGIVFFIKHVGGDVLIVRTRELLVVELH